MASTAQTFYAQSSKESSPTPALPANCYDLTDVIAASNNFTTVLSYTTNAQVVKQVIPFTTNSATATIPATGAAATGNGWRATQALVASTTLAQRRIAAGTVNASLIGSTGTYALLAANPNYTVTAILYRVTAAGTYVELGRGTGSAAVAASTTFNLLAPITLASDVILAAGESFQIEYYLTAQATANVLNQVTNNTVPINVATTAGGGDCSVGLPSPGLRTAYTQPVTDTVVQASDAMSRVLTVQRRSVDSVAGATETLRRILTASRGLQDATAPLNLLQVANGNSGLELGTTAGFGNLRTSGANVPDASVEGGRAIEYTCTSAGLAGGNSFLADRVTRIPALPGTYYSASISVEAITATLVGKQVTLRLEFYDSTGTLIGTSFASDTTKTMTQAYQRITCVGIVSPSGTAFVTPTYYVTGAAVGEVWRYDAAMLTYGPVDPGYTNGTGSISDSLQRTTSQTRSVTETLTIAEILTRLVVFPRAVTDGSATSDLLTRLTRVIRTITDGFSTSDSLVRFAFFPRAITDGRPTSDLLVRVVTFNRFVTESGVVTEVVVALAQSIRFLTESGTVSETLVKVVTYGRFLTEYPQGVTPDYPVQFQPYKHWAGFLRLSSDPTNVYTATPVTITLIRWSDGFRCATQTQSQVDGSYSFPRDKFDPNDYYVAALPQDVGGTKMQDSTDHLPAF